MTDQKTSNRIAKVMARAGLCSRRDAEKWILDGRVQVNGEFIFSPALNVTSDDKILVDGEPLADPDAVRVWLYHKPRGLITTARDPQGRPTVFENLPKTMPRVISVGRLDLESEGLLLLTNSGELAKYLMAPSSNIERIYRVRVEGKPTQKQLDGLLKGITVKDVNYAPCKAVIESVQGNNTWVIMTLTEGKNREIRRIMTHLGHPVNRLIRTEYGPFKLGDLKAWAVEEIPQKSLPKLLPEFALAAV